MNFCPTHKTNINQANFDMYKFRNRLRNQHKYGVTDKRTINPFKLPSNYTPKKTAQYIETFADNIEKYTISQLNRDKTHPHTRDISTHTDMESLRNLKDVIFKKADKSGKIVILDRDKYVKECLRQLKNTDYYIPISSNPINALCTTIENTLRKMRYKSIITEANFQYLIPAADTRIPIFYQIPKIHKPKINGIYPGRPICAACNAPSEGITKYVDYYLNPLLQNTETYIRDSSHLVKRLTDINNVNRDTFLVTADVCALYTSIPHTDIIRAVDRILTDRPPPHHPPKETILELVSLIIHNSFFEFDDQIYLQIKGVGMGQKSSPTLACLFMVYFEKDFLPTQDVDILYYGRYIDDIIFITNSTYKEIIKFLCNMNNKHPHIKFTWNISKKRAIFLDLRIYKDNTIPDQWTLRTGLYCKATNVHQYLHFQSSHPKHCFKSIVYSQALRLVKIVYDDKSLIHELRTLNYNLKHRGYPHALIKEQIEKALKFRYDKKTHNTHETHENKDATTNRKDTHLKRPPLVITYDERLQQLGTYTHAKFRDIAHLPLVKENFPAPPLVAFRKPKSLGNLLISSRFSSEDADKYKPPPHNNKCKMCPQRSKANYIKSTANGNMIHVDRTLNCTSKQVIYAIVCKLCKFIYIGQTGGPLNVRFTQHRYHILKEIPTTPVAVHFNTDKHKYKHAIITPIVHIKDDNRRCTIEKRFIHKLGTKHPHGINGTPVPTHLPTHRE